MLILNFEKVTGHFSRVNSPESTIIPVGMEKNIGLQLKMTGDGSMTIYVPWLDEHYHSTFGAIREARHIFIEAGLLPACQGKCELAVLEVGLGTGLNAWLTACTCQGSNIRLNYVAIEPYLLDNEIIKVLNYTGLLQFPNGVEIFRSIHSAGSMEWISVSPGFKLFKFNGRFEDFTGSDMNFDLVFFDAFGPAFQPELWSPANFAKIFGMMIPGSLLVTYSVKGNVKRALKSAGFVVEKLPGPPGKREMLRARKPATSPGNP